MQRVIGTDIHRTFAEVVFWEAARLRPGGRVDMTRSGARRLSTEDEVVVEATGNVLLIDEFRPRGYGGCLPEPPDRWHRGGRSFTSGSRRDRRIRAGQDPRTGPARPPACRTIRIRQCADGSSLRVCYVSRTHGGGIARFEVVESEAPIVRLIFAWIGLERMSLRAVCRRLQQMGCQTRRGSTYCHASTIRDILNNPAYIGRAAFRRARFLPPRPGLRPIRGHLKPSPRATSRIPMPREEWIEIPVPPIVDPAVFEAVRAQLEENRRRKRERQRGQCWLLQGLTVCPPPGTPTGTNIGRRNTLSIKAVRSFSSMPAKASTMKWSAW
jgi:Recombinase